VTPTNVSISSTVMNVGMSLDSSLTMSQHVAAVCRSSLLHLRQLRAVMRPPSNETVHSFVSGCLDYCNSLLAAVSDGRIIQKLQSSVQNAAARLVTGLRKSDLHSEGTRMRHSENFTGCLYENESRTKLCNASPVYK